MNENNAINYLIIGAGGCGGSIGAFMAKAGKKVSFIARGAHKAAMKKDGLRLETTCQGKFDVKPVHVFDQEEYLVEIREGRETVPDVIFVCVKFYSLQALVPF